MQHSIDLRYQNWLGLVLRGVMLLAAVALADSVNAREETAQRCEVGTYVLSDGSQVDIAESEGGALRWVKFSGERGELHPQAGGTWRSTYGWTDRPDGVTVSFGECGQEAITFQGKPGKRVDLEVKDTVFERDGVRLAGRLVMPWGNDKVPLVVLVHGAEHDSALANYALQRIFPAQHIGVFVYDKRGTGVSGGEYTQNFDVLADDAVAAMKQAKRLAGGRSARVGYQGGSEGGWVVPLAVNRMPVDFAIVSFGLAVTVLEEDQQSVALDMHFHHHSSADTGKALELARAGEHVVETGGREGYERFDSLRHKYNNEPWYKDVHGDFLFFILPLDQRQIVEAIRKFRFNTTPFRYEPMPVLRASRTPQLWIVGTDDLESPSAETSRRIELLMGRGKPFTLATFPGAEHGMTEYELNAKGERVSTRFAEGYYQMMVDYIREGRVGARYGKAVVKQPRRSADAGHGDSTP